MHWKQGLKKNRLPVRFFFFKQNEIAKIKEKIYISSNAHVVIFSLLFGW